MESYSYTCHNCGAENSFKPKSEPQLLLETKLYDSKRTYVVDCEKCGAENSVTIETKS